jgi:hypothetical protein
VITPTIKGISLLYLAMKAKKREKEIRTNVKDFMKQDNR